MAHTEVDYYAPITYPNVYLTAVGVDRIGKSSINYKVL